MAQPIRRGSRFPVSLFEPTALWDPVSEFEYLRDRMGRLYEQITPQGSGQSPWQPDIEVDETTKTGPADTECLTEPTVLRRASAQVAEVVGTHTSQRTGPSDR